MTSFQVIKDVGGLKDLCEIIPSVYMDDQTCIIESFNQTEMRKAGLPIDYVQDNQVFSYKNVLRGLHYQINNPQSKLVRVVCGEIFDVAVDVRAESETFGKWYGIKLSGDNKKQLYIPGGFAHGYLVLSDEAIVQYKVTHYWCSNDEIGIPWNDPFFSIRWPTSGGAEPILAEKDRCYRSFSEHSVYLCDKSFNRM